MKRLFIALIFCAILAVACSFLPGTTYQDSLLTAIAQTQTAYPTATSTATPTFTPPPTETPLPTDTPAPTATPDTSIAVTQQAASMTELLEKLKTDKVLENTEGTYTKLADVTKESNVLGSFTLVSTNRSPQNFVLRADVAWSVDGGQADWAMTGPAFAFHENTPNYMAVHVGVASGTIKLMRSVNNVLGRITKGPVSNLPYPEGKSQMVLVVNRTLIKLYLDGKDTFTANYSGLMTQGWDKGNLSLGLASGNANGYGTRITFTNIELWELKEGQGGAQ